MTALATAMLAVLSTWFVLTLVFVGLGLLVRRSLGFETRRVEPVLGSFWVGWGAAVAFLQVWHIVFRVDWRALLLVMIAGGVGIAVNAGDLSVWLREAAARQRVALTWTAVVLVVAVWTSNQAIGPPRNWDTGLYHLNAIRWATACPVVPGLGNLHHPLAFNNSSFLYLAMLETLPWRGMSHHVGNGLLLTALLVQILASVPETVRVSGAHWLTGVFMLFLLPPTLLRVSAAYSPNSSPDVAVFVIGVVITGHLVALVFREGDDPEESAFRVFAICFLSSVGVTVKASLLALGVATSTMALVLYATQGRGTRRRSRRRSTVLAIALTTGAVLGAWLVRGAILSGYPVYPSTLGGLAVDWRIPQASVWQARNWILTLARLPDVHSGRAAGGWDWLAPWAMSMIRDRWEFDLPVGLTVVGACLAVSARFLIGNTALGSLRAWWMLLPMLTSLVFWFLTAPELRYVGAGLWGLAAMVAALALQETRRSARAHRLCAGIAWVVIVPSLVMMAFYVPKYLNGPGTNGGFHPVPAAPMRPFTTTWGLVVLVPEHHLQSWDAPPPATPYPHPRLRLRAPGDLCSGFRLEPFREDEYVGISQKLD